MYSPIIIFCYNRPAHLRHSIDSLKKNSEALHSNLYVFVEGSKNAKDTKAIREINDFLSTLTGFNSVTFYNSKQNKGLANSIINGVSKIISEHGRAIILEDDLVYSNNFLSYLNQGLEFYHDNDKVFSICAYTNKISLPKDYPLNTYFAPRSSSWGWATWAHQWQSVDWQIKDWSTANAKKFNRWGGSDCYSMLKNWKQGKIDSWAIRFCYSQFLQDKVSVFPAKSLVANNGFDGQGTNCKKYSRFKYELDTSENKDFSFAKEVRLNKKITRSVLKYHSITERLKSKFMYFLSN